MRYILIVAILVFVGCGEDTPTSTPVASEEEDFKDLEQLEENQTREDMNISTMEDGNISVNMEIVENSSSEDTVEEPEDIANSNPTLLSEDLESINTQLESIYFDYDRFSIKEEMLQIVEKNVKLMNSEQISGKGIIIEGNCDEWGTDEYNYALGLKRAEVIKNMLIVEGVNSERIKSVSYGESNPICLEQADKCWAKNRRVDFRLEE
jgi:peptidoglycan-associated lipoprotein